jgi:DNA invertase Pin-like site-specific DNA recombinase
VQQTTENQRRALDEVAERAGWQVVEIYADEISGTKGRKRPSPSQARSQMSTARFEDRLSCVKVIARQFRSDPFAETARLAGWYSVACNP